MVGLHTCGDLAPSTLRMFVAKPELAAVCSVGCCYHLLSEEFDPARQGSYTHIDTHGVCCTYSSQSLSLFFALSLFSALSCPIILLRHLQCSLHHSDLHYYLPT